MAKSLSKIMDQIEKLQKEAAAIQSTVIARIKREIAQHGLTADQLFGSPDGTFVGKGRAASPKVAKAKNTAAKPAKFADDQGNAWHGVGKRPKWIHDALAAGRSLEEFLVGANLAAPAPKKTLGTAKVAPKKVKKVAARKVAAPAKKVGKPTKAAVAAKPAAKVPTKKAVKVAPARKAAAKKASKAAGTAKPAGKATAKKATAKKIATSPSAAAVAEAGQTAA